MQPAYPYRKVSLIQSRTRSALSPILQSRHSSNFFALSTSRIYCLYPKLFAARVNITMQEHMPYMNCVFDSFNYGLISFTKTDEWDVFPGGGCGEACPSRWRRTRNLPGVGVFRWGGNSGSLDTGSTVSQKDNFGDTNELWKLEGECSNQHCPTIVLCVSLLKAIF